MMYPDAVEINGIEYPINTGYEYAVACFNCINDTEISDTERGYGVIGILYKTELPDDVLPEALRLAIKFLQCGKEQTPSEHKPDMDFEYDESYIKASFLSDYKIDLDNNTDMHWWKFCTLLQGLTDDCILNRVRDLRNYDLSTIKDVSRRQKTAKAQADVALPQKLTPGEKDAVDDLWAELNN